MIARVEKNPMTAKELFELLKDGTSYHRKSMTGIGNDYQIASLSSAL